jgi:hypothetical protein
MRALDYLSPLFFFCICIAHSSMLRQLGQHTAEPAIDLDAVPRAGRAFAAGAWEETLRRATRSDRRRMEALQPKPPSRPPSRPPTPGGTGGTTAPSDGGLLSWAGVVFPPGVPATASVAPSPGSTPRVNAPASSLGWDSLAPHDMPPMTQPSLSRASSLTTSPSVASGFGGTVSAATATTSSSSSAATAGFAFSSGSHAPFPPNHLRFTPSASAPLATPSWSRPVTPVTPVTPASAPATPASVTSASPATAAVSLLARHSSSTSVYTSTAGPISTVSLFGPAASAAVSNVSTSVAETTSSSSSSSALPSNSAGGLSTFAAVAGNPTFSFSPGLPSLSGAEFVPQAQPCVPQDELVCQVCTYINAPPARQCVMCSTPLVDGADADAEADSMPPPLTALAPSVSMASRSRIEPPTRTPFTVEMHPFAPSLPGLTATSTVAPTRVASVSASTAASTAVGDNIAAYQRPAAAAAAASGASGAGHTHAGLIPPPIGVGLSGGVSAAATAAAAANAPVIHLAPTSSESTFARPPRPGQPFAHVAPPPPPTPAHIPAGAAAASASASASSPRSSAQSRETDDVRDEFEVLPQPALLHLRTLWYVGAGETMLEDFFGLPIGRDPTDPFALPPTADEVQAPAYNALMRLLILCGVRITPKPDTVVPAPPPPASVLGHPPGPAPLGAFPMLPGVFPPFPLLPGMFPVGDTVAAPPTAAGAAPGTAAVEDTTVMPPMLRLQTKHSNSDLALDVNDRDGLHRQESMPNMSPFAHGPHHSWHVAVRPYVAPALCVFYLSRSFALSPRFTLSLSVSLSLSLFLSLALSLFFFFFSFFFFFFFFFSLSLTCTCIPMNLLAWPLFLFLLLPPISLSPVLALSLTMCLVLSVLCSCVVFIGEQTRGPASRGTVFPPFARDCSQPTG